jgi:hypothetical protein
MRQSLLMLSAGLLATALLALPAQAQVQITEVEPADHPSVVHTHANTPAVVSGAVTFGVAYGAAVIVAATTDRDANKHLYIPLVGPWLAISNRADCPGEQDGCSTETGKKILLGVDGVFQAAGAVVLAYGLLTPRSYTRSSVGGQPVEIVPVAMQGGGRGLGFTGTF